MSNAFLNKRVAKFTYDVAKHGGTRNTTITIGRVPGEAIITDAYAVVRTDLANTNLATTISFGYASTAAGLLAATSGTNLNAFANKVVPMLPGAPALGADAEHDTAPEVAALKAASFIRTTAITPITLTIANTTDYTAGVIDVYIEYVV